MYKHKIIMYIIYTILARNLKKNLELICLYQIGIFSLCNGHPRL